MLKFGNKEFRNLQEQVFKNMSDINFILQEEGVLNEFGIKVVGEEESAANMPTVADYKENNPDWEYGDAYAVGTEAPYELYVLTRANGTHPNDYWFNIGEFPAEGPQGEQGPEGPQGPQGETGNPGQNGASAGFGTPTASATTLEAGQDATVSISASGPDTEKIFSFTFGIPKGEDGETPALEWGSITGDIDDQSDLVSALQSKQNTLVSGTSIKTINGESVLGSGNLIAGAKMIEYGDTTISASDLLAFVEAGGTVVVVDDAEGFANYYYLATVSRNSAKTQISMTFTSEAVSSLGNNVPFTYQCGFEYSSGSVTWSEITSARGAGNYDLVYGDDVNITNLKEAISKGQTVRVSKTTTDQYDSEITSIYVLNTIEDAETYYQLFFNYTTSSSANSGTISNTRVRLTYIYSPASTAWYTFSTVSVDNAGGAGTVTDVEVNGTSVVSSGVADITISAAGISGDYSDLLNTPTIPSKTSDLTNDSGFITSSVDDLTYYTKTSGLAIVAISGSYNDLSNKPSIPAAQVNSDWEASSGVAEILHKPDLSVYAESSSLGDCAYLDENELSIAYSQITGTPTIPTATSDLTNDSGFITKSVNDLTYYTLSSSLAAVATSGSYNDLSNKPTIPSVPVQDVTIGGTSCLSGTTAVIPALFSGNYNDLTNKPTIPTNTSDLNNDSGFITSSDLSGYVTTNTAQTVTADKTMDGAGVKFTDSSNVNPVTFKLYLDNYNNLIVDRAGQPSYLFATSQLSGMPGGTKDLGSSQYKWNDAYLGRYIHFYDSTNTSNNVGDIKLDNLGRIRISINDTPKLNIATDVAAFRVNLGADSNNTYDLGTSNYRWKDLYLSGNADITSATFSNSGSNTLSRFAVDQWGTLCLQRNSGGNWADALLFTGSNITPRATSANFDIGSSLRLFKNLYLAGNLTDGTNSVSIADLAALITYAKGQGWIS